jgi:hypothetical protein
MWCKMFSCSSRDVVLLIVINKYPRLQFISTDRINLTSTFHQMVLQYLLVTDEYRI